jgi:drug/metabolite transporter (DMT)-like permease
MTTTTTTTTTTRPRVASGLTLALVSAASFGFSGPLAKGLLGAGWSPGAIVLVRVGGAALVLAVPGLLALRGRARPRGRDLRTVLLFGVVAVAGVQLAFFNAVQTLDVGVALLLEYMGTVLVVGWVWARTRVRPGPATAGGVVLSVLGLVLVLDLSGAQVPALAGVLWGLLAATGLACYFVVCAEAGDDLPPMLLTAAGMAVGALTLALAGLTGVIGLTVTTEDAVLAGQTLPWWVPVVAIVLVPTVLSYRAGVQANALLGSRLASVTGLTEVLFAVLAAWLLLGEWPAPVQAAGGVLIVAGIVVIRRAENDGVRSG